MPQLKVRYLDKSDTGLVRSELARSEVVKAAFKLVHEWIHDHVRKHPIIKAWGAQLSWLFFSTGTLRSILSGGDIFLLCTDGLTSMLDKSLIRQVIPAGLSLSLKVSRLIEEANSARGHNSITVILCEMGRAS